MSMLRGVGRVGWAVALGSLVACAGACQSRTGSAARSASPGADSAAAAAAQPARGQHEYLAYCAMCHGNFGEGDGPLAAEIEHESKTPVASLNDAERLAQLGRSGVTRVLTVGGGSTHRSHLMPPFGGLLSAETVGDIAGFVLRLPELKPGIPRTTIEKYLAAPAGAPAAGRALFVYYCSMCHGPYGKGDGFLADSLAARYQVHPRDLTQSAYFAGKTDRELFETVSLGGSYTGHSVVMPNWSVTLTPGQIQDLIAYVRAASASSVVP